MSTTALEIYRKILQDEEFRNIYLDNFLDRFVYSIEDVEHSDNEEKRQNMIDSLLKAFKMVLSSLEKMSPADIQKIGNIINEHNGIADFRKINVIARFNVNWEVVPPQRIYYELYNLLNNYYNVWSALDNVYEKEAMFHIALMRIHPFEDGNKRLCRTIMNIHFFHEGYAPVVISEKETEQYYDFINNVDVRGFAKFLEERSMIEAINAKFLYKTIKEIPIKEEVDGYLKNSIKR